MTNYKYFDGQEWIELLKSSDVSAWAKAPTKPSYTLDEVSDGSTRKLPATNVIPAINTANKILLSTTTSGTSKWSDGALSSSATKPLYLNSSGVLTAGNTYAGGTAVTLNNSSKASSTASFYAPTTGGNSYSILLGNGTASTPVWSNNTTWSGMTGFLYINSSGRAVTIYSDGWFARKETIPSSDLDDLVGSYGTFSGELITTSDTYETYVTSLGNPNTEESWINRIQDGKVIEYHYWYDSDDDEYMHERFEHHIGTEIVDLTNLN